MNNARLIVRSYCNALQSVNRAGRSNQEAATVEKGLRALSRMKPRPTASSSTHCNDPLLLFQDMEPAQGRGWLLRPHTLRGQPRAVPAPARPPPAPGPPTGPVLRRPAPLALRSSQVGTTALAAIGKPSRSDGLRGRAARGHVSGRQGDGIESSAEPTPGSSDLALSGVVLASEVRCVWKPLGPTLAGLCSSLICFTTTSAKIDLRPLGPGPRQSGASVRTGRMHHSSTARCDSGANALLAAVLATSQIATPQAGCLRRYRNRRGLRYSRKPERRQAGAPRTLREIGGAEHLCTRLRGQQFPISVPIRLDSPRVALIRVSQGALAFGARRAEPRPRPV